MTNNKVQATNAPTGDNGLVYLASGENVAMRMWNKETPTEGDSKPAAARDYETVGYVIAGRAELHLEGQILTLEPGDSWVVPKSAVHTYKILEPFTAVEATYPPFQKRMGDEA